MGGLVISGGRVVDPASGMDAIGDIAVVDGRISAVGTDLGSAVKGFKDGMKSEEEKPAPVKAEIPPSTGQTIDGEARKETPKV